MLYCFSTTIIYALMKGPGGNVWHDNPKLSAFFWKRVEIVFESCGHLVTVFKAHFLKESVEMYADSVKDKENTLE